MVETILLGSISDSLSQPHCLTASVKLSQPAVNPGDRTQPVPTQLACIHMVGPGKLLVLIMGFRGPIIIQVETNYLPSEQFGTIHFYCAKH
jgi:hypothetical protein